MREFKVIIDGHTFAVVTDDRAYVPLTGPEVERVIEHLLYPDVGTHHRNKNKLCKVCNDE